MEEYKHTQVGYIHVIAWSAIILFLACINIFTGFEPYTLIFLILLAVLLALLSTLTVRVGGGAITVQFGVGIIRKRILLSDVETYAKVRNPWYYGLGIRYTPRGWLYNIFGLSAIELLMKNGRTCRIGTDDPDGFAQALCEALNGSAD
jgi:hypothetical protein